MENKRGSLPGCTIVCYYLLKPGCDNVSWYCHRLSYIPSHEMFWTHPHNQPCKSDTTAAWPLAVCLQTQHRHRSCNSHPVKSCIHSSGKKQRHLFVYFFADFSSAFTTVQSHLMATLCSSWVSATILSSRSLAFSLGEYSLLDIAMIEQGSLFFIKISMYRCAPCYSTLVRYIHCGEETVQSQWVVWKESDCKGSWVYW